MQKFLTHACAHVWYLYKKICAKDSRRFCVAGHFVRCEGKAQL